MTLEEIERFAAFGKAPLRPAEPQIERTAHGWTVRWELHRAFRGPHRLKPDAVTVRLNTRLRERFGPSTGAAVLGELPQHVVLILEDAGEELPVSDVAVATEIITDTLREHYEAQQKPGNRYPSVRRAKAARAGRDTRLTSTQTHRTSGRSSKTRDRTLAKVAPPSG